MRYKRKTKQNKKLWIIISFRKNGMCTGKNEKQNRTIHKKNNIHYPIYRNSQGLVLDKVNVAEIHIYVSFSFRRGFLSFI